MLEKKAGEISLMSLRLKVSALFLIDLSPLVLLNSYGRLLLCVLWRTNLLFVKSMLSSPFIFF